MFDPVKNMKTLASLMGNAKQLREKVEHLQAELQKKTVEADAGAGAVCVVINGRMEVLRVRLNQPLLASLAGQGSDADAQMVEDLIAAAINAALQKAQEMTKQEMAKLTGGINIPGLEGLLGH